jgi:hypothetical protein
VETSCGPCRLHPVWLVEQILTSHVFPKRYSHGRPQASGRQGNT